MTKKEQQNIERVCDKPIQEVEELEIPSYIRARDQQATKEALKIQAEQTGFIQREIEQQKWAELHGARQNEEGEWEV